MRLQDLHEERQPDLAYKEKRVKGELDRVTVELGGNYSGAMSRLTTRYSRLDTQAKLMVERRNSVNVQMKDVVQRLFDAEDQVLTRVVDTCSYTIMLTKAEKAETKESSKKIDYEAIVKELSKMVPELTEQIQAITAKYTELIPSKDTPASLRVKPRVAEGLGTNIALAALGFTAAIVVEMISGLVTKILSWTKSYDKRLNVLKAKLC